MKLGVHVGYWGLGMGPQDQLRDRIAAFRDAGIGTLMITPMAFTVEDRIEQLRAVAELAA